MKHKFLSVCVLIAMLSLIMGCNGSKADEYLTEIQQLEIQINTLEEQLSTAQSTIDQLIIERRRQALAFETEQREKQDLQRRYEGMESSYQFVADDFEDFYFSICHEVKSEFCNPELFYFDPRKVNVGDQIFAMTVSHVEVGTFDPPSYVLSLQGTAIIFGQYVYSKEVAMGPNLWITTNQINGENVSVKLGIDGDRDTLDEIFSAKSNDEVTMKVEDIVFQLIPHKPAYSGAGFLSLVNDED